MSRPGKSDSICWRNLESIAIMSSKWPCVGQSLIIHTCPSRSMICAFISPTLSLISIDTSFSPLRIDSRASITQFGQSESVVRGKPRVGFDFCHDFKSGLSDHFGVNDGFGLNWLTDRIAPNTPFATYVNPFSKCFTGLMFFYDSPKD